VGVDRKCLGGEQEGFKRWTGRVQEVDRYCVGG
jgi:hypothetical protein